jgi:hypothetical protein
MHVPGFKPGAQPWVEDLRLALPEIRLQPALNLEMIQLQLDARNVFGEIAADIVHAHMKPCDSASLALCLDDHTYLLFNVDEVSLESCARESLFSARNIRVWIPSLQLTGGLAISGRSCGENYLHS